VLSKVFHRSQKKLRGRDNDFHKMAAENDEDLYITEIRTPLEANFYDPGSALRNAYRFLKNLPKVDIRELPADERDCEICLEAYGTNELDRKAVKLPPCGHR